MTTPQQITALKSRIAQAVSGTPTWQLAGETERYLEAFGDARSLPTLLERIEAPRTSAPRRQIRPNGRALFSTLGRLDGSAVEATDGLIGRVEAALFDDDSLTIRYLVVDGGTWLKSRKVLISPRSVKQRVDGGSSIHVSLTRDQVKASPDIDTRQPVTRRHERDLLGYYAHRAHWAGGDIRGWGGHPRVPAHQPTSAEAAITTWQTAHDDDVHLHSSANVAGYDIEASDGSIGHVEDFVFDGASWAVRYLVVDTRNWWPGGRRVLVATHWIDGIDWSTGSVRVSLTRAQVKKGPEYRETTVQGRDDEEQVRDAEDRQGPRA